MTVENAAKLLCAEVINMPNPERIIDSAYSGDLISWVMGHAKNDNAWITIMTNINVLAVASLIDLSCVIICEDANIEEDFISTAISKEINVIKCKEDAFNVSLALGKLLNE